MWLIKINEWLGRTKENDFGASPRDGQEGGAAVKVLIAIVVVISTAMLLPIALVAGLLGLIAGMVIKLPGLKYAIDVFGKVACSDVGRTLGNFGIEAVKKGGGALAAVTGALSDVTGFFGDGVKFVVHNSVGKVPLVGSAAENAIDFVVGAPQSALGLAETMSNGLVKGADAVKNLLYLFCGDPDNGVSGLYHVLNPDKETSNRLERLLRGALDCANWPSYLGPVDKDFCIDGNPSEDLSKTIPDWLVPIYQDAGAKYDVPWHLLAAINYNDTNFGAKEEWRKHNDERGNRVGWIPFDRDEWAVARNDNGGVAPTFSISPYGGQANIFARGKTFDKCPIPQDPEGNDITGVMPAGDSAGNGNLTMRQIGELMLRAGFPEEEVMVGMAIAWQESKGDPKADNKTSDATGLWQIMLGGVHPVSVKQAEDPEFATKYALKLYRNRIKAGNNGWADWEAFNAGHYRQHMELARKAARELGVPSDVESAKFGTHKPSGDGKDVGGGVSNVFFDYSSLPDGEFDTCDPVDGIYGLAKWLSANGVKGEKWAAALQGLPTTVGMAEWEKKTLGGLSTLGLGNGPLQWPTEKKGSLIQGSNFQGGTHDPNAEPNNWMSDNGLDIGVPKGTNLIAADDGKIARVGGDVGDEGRFGGGNVYLKTDDNQVWYTHMSKITVKVGDRVKRGDVIGRSGIANGVAHLHVAVEKGKPETLFGVSGGTEAGDQADLTEVTKGSLGWPSHSHVISSPFGPRSSPGGIGSSNHQGIDIALPVGTGLYAAEDGKADLVQSTAQSGGYGNLVCIRHSAKIQTCYAHMDKVSVKRGDQVERGDKIGLSGSTGNSTGPHLHFEVRVDGEQVNPVDYLGDGDAKGDDDAPKNSDKANDFDNGDVEIIRGFDTSAFPKLEEMMQPGVIKVDSKLPRLPRPSISQCKDATENDVSLGGMVQAAGKTYKVPTSALFAMLRLDSQNGCFLGDHEAPAWGWIRLSDQTAATWGVQTGTNDREHDVRASGSDAIFTAARYLAKMMREGQARDQGLEEILLRFKLTNSKDRTLWSVGLAEELDYDKIPDGIKTWARDVLDAMAASGNDGAQSAIDNTIKKVVQRRDHTIDRNLCGSAKSYSDCIMKLYRKLYAGEQEKDTEVLGELSGGCGLQSVPAMSDITSGGYTNKKPMQNKSVDGLLTGNNTWGRTDAVKATRAVIKQFEECYPEYKRKIASVRVNDFGYATHDPKMAVTGHASHQNGADNDNTLDGVNITFTSDYDRSKAKKLAAMFLRAGAHLIFFNDSEVQQYFIKQRAQILEDEPKYASKYKGWLANPVQEWPNHNDHFHVRWYTGASNDPNGRVEVFLGGDVGADDTSDADDASKAQEATGAFGDSIIPKGTPQSGGGK